MGIQLSVVKSPKQALEQEKNSFSIKLLIHKPSPKISKPKHEECTTTYPATHPFTNTATHTNPTRELLIGILKPNATKSSFSIQQNLKLTIGDKDMPSYFCNGCMKIPLKLLMPLTFLSKHLPEDHLHYQSPDCLLHQHKLLHPS